MVIGRLCGVAVPFLRGCIKPSRQNARNVERNETFFENLDTGIRSARPFAGGIGSEGDFLKDIVLSDRIPIRVHQFISDYLNHSFMEIQPLELLFTSKGRVSRITYWVSQVVVGAAYVGLQRTDSFAWAIIVLLLMWPVIAIMVKRCHDRNKSGFWVLLLLIPLVGPMWALIELGILKGTDGSNHYGQDPLQSNVLPA